LLSQARLGAIPAGHRFFLDKDKEEVLMTRIDTAARRRRSVLKLGVLAIGAGLTFPIAAAEPIKIGLTTALSGQSARAGEAITRGLTIAIEELNAKGGVLDATTRRRRRRASRRRASWSTRRRWRCSSAGSTPRCRSRSSRS
jgi:hypothetical protein